jgi:hypothetical protein
MVAGAGFTVDIFEVCPLGCFSNAYDTLSGPTCTLCPAGNYNDVYGASSCRACGAGSYNSGDKPAVSCTLCESGSYSISGQSSCTLCPPGTFNDVNGSASCTPCIEGLFNPVNGSKSANDCLACFPGSYNPDKGAAECHACPAGTFNSEYGSVSCFPCPKGTSSTSINASSSNTCQACDAGKYNPNAGASDCLGCPVGTFSSEKGGVECRQCPPGSYCPTQSHTPCVCKLFEYQPDPGQQKCLPCPLSAKLVFNSTTCHSQAASSRVSPVYYHLLAVLFGCIAVTAVVLTVRLVRSRRTAYQRTVRVGICLYVSTFVPYAVLQAVTLSELANLNNRSVNSLDRITTQISSSTAFAAFFGLGFSGKVALVQMWTHVVRQHTIGVPPVLLCAPHQLQSTLASTYRAFVSAAAFIVVGYIIGFAVLTSMYMTSYNQCSAFQDQQCVSMAHQQCSDINAQARALQYYEGVWAVVVLFVFTILAFLFNGVVFAL